MSKSSHKFSSPAILLKKPCGQLIYFSSMHCTDKFHYQILIYYYSLTELSFFGNIMERMKTKSSLVIFFYKFLMQCMFRHVDASCGNKYPGQQTFQERCPDSLWWCYYITQTKSNQTLISVIGLPLGVGAGKWGEFLQAIAEVLNFSLLDAATEHWKVRNCPS